MHTTHYLAQRVTTLFGCNLISGTLYHTFLLFFQSCKVVRSLQCIATIGSFFVVEIFHKEQFCPDKEIPPAGLNIFHMMHTKVEDSVT